MKEIKEILKHVGNLAEGEKAILATVVDVRGSGYRLPGARMLMLENGDTFGTVSGGCLEADVLERAKKVLKSGVAETFTYDTTGDENSVFSLNMGCRGVVDILLEPIGKDSEIITKMRGAYESRESNDEFETPIAVMLFGAGADAVPFVRIASELGWQVTVHDHRHAFLTEERFPDAQKLVHQTVDEPPQIDADERTAGVIMTHNYARDCFVLPELLDSDAFYVGALGPKRRTEQLLEEIAADGRTFTEEKLARLFAPVGLDIGADTPESIALSIIGEIQSVLKNRQGTSLRYREGSIYDRK
ncbi:MAG: XdhC/CoxI family protein [Pyrinomonadaceae bacterium]